jgi:hypothetical protein
MKGNQPRSSNRNLAYRITLKGLRDKLPIFLITVIAWISLSVLDRSKSNYQAARNLPIEVNDEFLKATKDALAKKDGLAKNDEAAKKDEVAAEDEAWTSQLNDPYHIKYRKYANQRELLDALAASAMADNTMRQASVQAASRDLWNNWQQEKTRLSVENDNARERVDEITKEKEKLANGASGGSDASEKDKANQMKKLDQELKTVDETIQKNTVSLAEGEKKHNASAAINAATIQGLYSESRERIDAIYNEFGAKLPGIILAIQQKPRGPLDSLFDSLLKPVLDEQSSLYVVFQTLRLTALILLVLSFGFVLVMALRQLPLTNGSDALTDQFKSLIAFKPGGGGQDIARAAVLSVAAVGVGTAAFVAGNSINDKANRALEMASTTAASATSGNPLLRSAYNAQSNTYRLNPTTDLSFAQYIANATTYNDGGFHLPDFKPVNNITVPDPVLHIIGVPDRAGTRALITQINAIGSKLPLADFAALKTSVANAQQDLALIKNGLGGFKDQAVAANDKLGNIDGSLKKLSTEPLLTAATRQNELAVNTNQKLDLLSHNIENLRDDTVWPPRSDGRNLASRASQLFGSETFAVSENSSQGIKDHLPKSADYNPIRDALDEIRYGLPAGKQSFLRALRDKTAAHAGNASASALEKLKPWEAVILSYSRLPR